MLGVWVLVEEGDGVGPGAGVVAGGADAEPEPEPEREVVGAKSVDGGFATFCACSHVVVSSGLLASYGVGTSELSKLGPRRKNAVMRWKAAWMVHGGNVKLLIGSIGLYACDGVYGSMTMVVMTYCAVRASIYDLYLFGSGTLPLTAKRGSEASM